MMVRDVETTLGKRLLLLQPAFNHEIIKVAPGVYSVLTEDVTLRQYICDFVHQTSSELDHSGSVDSHSSVCDVRWLVSETGHLEQLESELGVLTSI